MINIKKLHSFILNFLYALLEKCWRISLYVTDDAIAKVYSMWRKV